MQEPSAKQGGEVHITWDEETIAEHDKERGTRQKIEEAPTPYRYTTDEDEAEMVVRGGGEGDAMVEAGTSPQAYASSPPDLRPGDNVMDSWESLRAKLHYEQQKQDIVGVGDSDGTNGTGTAFDGGNNNKGANAEAAQGARTTESSQSMDAVTVGFDTEPIEGSAEFKNKRSQHYNEFQLMKAMREKMAQEDDKDDEDEN